LEFRIKAGEPARVEDYLARHPELGDRPEDVRELVHSEFRQRHRREPNLDFAAFRRRFPHLGLNDPPTLPLFESATPPPAEAPPGPATWPTVPGYEIEAELGRGGMGV